MVRYDHYNNDHKTAVVRHFRFQTLTKAFSQAPTTAADSDSHKTAVVRDFRFQTLTKVFSQAPTTAADNNIDVGIAQRANTVNANAVENVYESVEEW